MSHWRCSEESATARAVRSGERSESLEAHLRECAICRDVQEAALWMQSLSADGGAPEDLPDPQVLWLRAQLSRRRAAAERAQNVLQWVEIAGVTAACAGLVVWLAWSWNDVGGEVADGLGWALFDAWPALWANAAAYGPLNSPIVFASAVAATAIVTLGVAYPLLARE